MKALKSLLVIIILMIIILLFTSFPPENPLKGVPFEETGKIYGFLQGLLNGFTAIFAFIVNLFGGRFCIYQVHNNGNWYDIGFILGVSSAALTITSINKPHPYEVRY